MKEIKKFFARTLRKDQTKAEKIAWELLRNRKLMHYKFRRQHVVEGFVLDFYCHELKLGIEIDGGIHKKRKNYDELRKAMIESEGIQLLRFTNKEIFENKKSVLIEIEEAIKHKANPSPRPLWRSLGEGGKNPHIIRDNLGEGFKTRAKGARNKLKAYS